MSRSLLLALCLGLGASSLTGCVAEERVAVREPVVYAEAAPPPRVEVISVSPGPRYVWMRGHWIRHRGGWVWVSGRWHYR
jgi:hypothetical protein